MHNLNAFSHFKYKLLRVVLVVLVVAVVINRIAAQRMYSKLSLPIIEPLNLNLSKRKAVALSEYYGFLVESFVCYLPLRILLH